MRKMCKLKSSALLILILALYFFAYLCGNVIIVRADNKIDMQNAFEERNVMDDLKGSMIDGKAFNLKDYGLNSRGALRVFSFVEFGYSYDFTRQNDYGLYVYVYNPQAEKFVYNSVQNKIEFGVGSSADSISTYNKYSLMFLNMCMDTDYVGVFLKFKVIMSNVQKQAILDILNSSERIYRVNAQEYSATGVKADGSEGSILYKYSGYSKGYGVDVGAETLNVTQEEGDVLRLQVYHTSWREKGVTNGKDMFTQDSINSVYFAVPKEISQKYGYLSEVHAEWLNAVTAWGLVTGNRDVYEHLYNYVGKDIGKKNADVGKIFYGAYSSKMGEDMGHGINSGWGSQIVYNPFSNLENYYETITQLNWLFSAGNGIDVADKTVIDSDTLFKWYSEDFLKIVGNNFDSETVELKDGIKIYKALFDDIDTEIKDYHTYNWV